MRTPLECAVIRRWLHSPPGVGWRIVAGLMCLTFAGSLAVGSALAPDPPHPVGVCGNCVPGEEP